MQMLKVSEVMEKLKLSKGKTYRLIKEGFIPSVNFKGSIRVPKDLLNQMIKEQIRIGKTNYKAEYNNTTLSSGGASERKSV